MSPQAAATPCVEVGCFNLAIPPSARCLGCGLMANKRNGHELRRGSARERGYGRWWEHARVEHLALEPFCRTCGLVGNQVDHVIPHRGARWLFEMTDNLQTLCSSHHSQKTAKERKIPIGMMYPIDLPKPKRPTAIACGPGAPRDDAWTIIIGQVPTHGVGWADRNRLLREQLEHETDVRLAVVVAAPRIAHRAYWSHVMGCQATLYLPDQSADAEAWWWAEHMIDEKAKAAMKRRAIG